MKNNWDSDLGKKKKKSLFEYKKSVYEKKNPLWLWTSYIYLQYAIIISQSHVLYDLTISCTKQEQTEEEDMQW